jgi:hypothetical protein
MDNAQFSYFRCLGCREQVSHNFHNGKMVKHTYQAMQMEKDPIGYFQMRSHEARKEWKDESCTSAAQADDGESTNEDFQRPVVMLDIDKGAGSPTVKQKLIYLLVLFCQAIFAGYRERK